MMFKKKNKGGTGTVKRRTVYLVSDPEMPFNYVEAFKSLRTNLKFLGNGEGGKSFVVTSALSKESKSNVTVNLCITLAADNKKVILLDADLRKPVIHNALKIKQHNIGLTSILSGEVPAEQAIIHVEKENFDVIPCGVIPPNPSELLSQDRMGKLIDSLKKEYDYIIVDAPPVSIVTDAAVIGSMVDGALLVVRSDYAGVEAVQLAKKNLEDANVKIFGVIMTRFNPKAVHRQNSYSYYKYYGYNYSYSNKTTKSQTK